jgi:hypothetical protein
LGSSAPPSHGICLGFNTGDRTEWGTTREYHPVSGDQAARHQRGRQLLEGGPVHVISRNQPKSVILDEMTCEELAAAKHRAFVAEVRESLAEVAAGNVQRYETTQELMDAIRQAGKDE